MRSERPDRVSNVIYQNATTSAHYCRCRNAYALMHHGVAFLLSAADVGRFQSSLQGMLQSLSPIPRDPDRALFHIRDEHGHVQHALSLNHMHGLLELFHRVLLYIEAEQALLGAESLWD